MKTRILLLRHGQSVANVEKFFAGQNNIPLTPLGIRQAEAAAEALKLLHIDKIYSSSLDRAYDTALPFAKMRGLEVIRLPEFIEWCAGDWEGMSFDDLKAEYPEEYHYWKNDMISLTMPNGESAIEVRERIGKALDRLADENPGFTVMVACHGGVIKTVPSYYANCDAKIFNATPIPKNCSITEIVYEGSVGRVERYSDESHLGALKSDAFII